jgi:hypothetical protein
MAGAIRSRAEEKPPAPPPLPFVVATVVDSVKGTSLVVSPYLTLSFAPGAFSEDTAVTARLEPVEGRLTLTSRGGELKPTALQLSVDLTQLPNGLQLRQTHRLDSRGQLVGVLTEVQDKPRPQLTAMTDSILEPATVDDSTIILLGENGKRAQQAKWSDLAYGDVVDIRYANGRRAEVVRASRVTGEAVVHHVSGNRLALAGGGKPLVINPQAKLEDADGKALTLASLEPDDKISYRQHPDTEEVWYLKRTVAAADSAPQLVVNHDGDKPLSPGERVLLRASGPTGGTVAFDVVGIDTDLSAKELRELPGTYEYVYTVPRGVKVAEAKVVARLRLPNGRANTVIGDKSLRFAGEGVPVAQTKPTTQPAKPGATPPAVLPLKPPVIVAPKDGENVGDKLVITGTAAPNQKVKINIAYVVTRKAFIVIEVGKGDLPEVEATADAKGAFRTEEIDTRVEALVKGDTDYTITVTALNEKGEESEPVVFKVRKPK